MSAFANGATSGPEGFDEASIVHVDAVVEHLNANHADTVLFIARSVAGRVDTGSWNSAEVTGVDPDGATVTIDRHDRTPHTIRVEFASRAASATDVQGHLFAALAAARAANPDAPLTSIEAELAITASLPTTHATVAGVRDLTPTMLEVTVGGLDDWPAAGGDEFVYVLVSHADGGIDPRYDMSRYRESDPSDPVRGAYYTIRRTRPSAGELDLWVALHDHPGSVAAWMRSASVGHRLALWGPRRGFEFPTDAERALLVADESGVCAVAALIEAAPRDLEIVAIIEGSGPDDRAPLPEHPLLDVHWIDRGDTPAGVGDHLLAAVRDRTDERFDCAFGGAESRRISAVRRHLRHVVGLPAARVSMTGYWRRSA